MIILPGHASPVVPVHRRSRLLEPDRCSAAARGLSLLGCAPRDSAAAAGRMSDFDPARLGLGRDGDGHVQNTVGVAGGEVLGVYALAEGELPGNEPWGRSTTMTWSLSP